VRTSVDVELARWLSEHRSDPVTTVCRHLEDLGTSGTFFLVVGVVFLVVVAVLRLWRHLPRVLIAVYISVVVCGQLKPLIDRPRPAAPLALAMLEGPAMPSSHAMFTSSVVAAVLLAQWWASTRLHHIAMLVGVAGCVASGSAMIYLGGHWLSDVLVGWVLGTGIAFAVMKTPVPRRRVQTA
jgi:membrane-associated phospholipid phosphatase